MRSRATNAHTCVYLPAPPGVPSLQGGTDQEAQEEPSVPRLRPTARWVSPASSSRQQPLAHAGLSPTSSPAAPSAWGVPRSLQLPPSEAEDLAETSRPQSLPLVKLKAAGWGASGLSSLPQDLVLPATSTAEPRHALPTAASQPLCREGSLARTQVTLAKEAQPTGSHLALSTLPLPSLSQEPR